MNLGVRKIPAKDWLAIAPDAHRAVFSEIMPPEYDRVDFALIPFDVDEELALGYMTVRELDAESVYLKYGGAFIPLAKTRWALNSFQLCLKSLLKDYRRITTLVENTNRGYLRMALAVGFIPIGIRNFKGTVLVELFLEDKLWTPSPLACSLVPPPAP